MALPYLEEGLRYREIGGNTSLIASSLLNLIQYHTETEHGDRDRASKYLDQIKELQQLDKTINEQLRHFYTFAQAVFLASSPRLRNKIKAEIMFKQLIDEPNLDIENKFIAHYYRVDLLLYELQMTKEETVFDDIITITKNISEFSKKSGVKIHLIRSSHLRSKVKLIQGEVEEAKKLLTEAINGAIEINDNRLLYAVAQDYDSLIQTEGQMRFQDSPQTLSDRIQAANLEQSVNQMIRKSIYWGSAKTESPIAFILMSKSTGGPYFTKTFDSEESLQINEHLLTSFLSAIVSFANTLFSSEGNLQRIDHEDYTILMQSRGDLLYNYIFKGESYHGILKLKEISDKLNLDKTFRYHTEQRLVTSTSKLDAIIEKVVSEVMI
ncbi:MAG: hypothetical protein IH840_17205 [Candidatus Heimdallarchaeota archaeon]|nr:hypothetical protein [Candidatus Heimdallarchaeota archaeon]